MKPVLIIDNFDSFVYNIYQYVGEYTPHVTVRRNNITIDEIEDIDPDRIIISPGPGRPEEAGISVEAIKHFSGKVPLLGVCLGHQAIGYAFGARVINATRLFHGKTSRIRHDRGPIYKGMTNDFVATRYHSLIVEEDTLPCSLKVDSRSDDSVIMGLSHLEHETFGVQFHPESILTQNGKRIIKNFLAL